MSRQLVTIRQISDIQPIPGADRIEVATVDGWKCVVQKDQFKVGDLAYYFEIDSLIPVEKFECFHFLRDKANHKNEQGEVCHRLRTVKMRKQISQGLLLPVGEFTFDYWDNDLKLNAEKDGNDLTGFFGVTKWEPKIPAQLAGKVRGNFPSFIPKTDEERLQNLWNDVKSRQDTYEVTVKLDGSSMTVYNWEGLFGVCSRNFDLEETEENAFWKVARQEDLMNKIPNGFAFQGELMGPGVQGNNENLDKLMFFVYNIWDIEQKRYLSSPERTAFCEELGLNHVPVFSTIVQTWAWKDIDTALYYCEIWLDGKSLNPNVKREGLVFKSIDDPFFSFKVISNEYLLQNGER